MQSKTIQSFWEGFGQKWQDPDKVAAHYSEYQESRTQGLFRMFDNAKFVSLDEADQYLGFQDSQNRVEAFFHVWEKIKHFEGIELTVKNTWISGENGDFEAARWAPVFASVDRDKLFKTDERLPKVMSRDFFTVFRGGTKEGLEKGISWTLSGKIAEKFATIPRRRFDGTGAFGISFHVPVEPTVIRAVAHVSDVLFFTNDRKEKECVMSPGWIEALEYSVDGDFFWAKEAFNTRTLQQIGSRLSKSA